MRVAIVGGPGVGKSTLVGQLGDLYHHGSYGEGEERIGFGRPDPAAGFGGAKPKPEKGKEFSSS